MEAYNNKKVNRWAFHRLVGKYQEPNTSIAKQHEQDLKYMTLVLYNSIINGLRKANFRSFFDVVVETSQFIEGSDYVKERDRSLECTMKQSLRYFYFEDSDDYRFDHRRPTKADTFKRFASKKTNRVKDCAITFVMEMYKQDRIKQQQLKK